MLLRIVIASIVIYKVNSDNKSLEKEIYNGNKFAEKYLYPEDYTPTTDDVNTYLNALEKTVKFFTSEPNKSDINKGITLFFVKGVIGRAILDDGHKMQPDQKAMIKHILAMADYVLSHYFYYNSAYVRLYEKPDLECRVTQLLRDDEILAHSLPEFSSNELEQWIRSKGQLNEYMEDMDSATLPKEKYAQLVEESVTSSNYHIHITVSDTCLSRVIRNFPPSPKNKQLQACKEDNFCMLNLHASPSIAYSLSHRMLNMFMYRTLRHCYWVSPESDDYHLDILCAFMYREAVYLARRGFFARDLFLEHVGLCGLRGYLEFYRKHWFMKAIQWIDEDGCIHDNHNFERNRTVASLLATEETAARKRISKRLKNTLKKQCVTHPMSVLVMFLSNAVRHAIHFVKN